jgi:hypothetical protein
MRNLTNTQAAEGKPLSRHQIIKILRSALQVKEYRFARHIAEHWLEKFNGDLQVETLQAQALFQDGRSDLAVPLLKKIINTDPEYITAQRLLAFASVRLPYSTVQNAKSSVYALGGNGVKKAESETWGVTLKDAQKAKINKEYGNAEKLFQQSLSEESNTPLPAALYLKFATFKYDAQTAQVLADQYLHRWPDSLSCMLILGDLLIKGGQVDRGMSTMQQAVSLDVAGQVAERLWGKNHPYTKMWPDNPAVTLPLPIPAAVTAELGWNRLEKGEYAPSHKSNDESSSKFSGNDTFEEIQDKFEAMASKVNPSSFGVADGRFPVYIMLSSMEGLIRQYGAESLPEINFAIKNIVKSTQELRSWDARLILVDEAKYTDQYQLPPAIPTDPKSIQAFVVGLDEALGKRGEMIGAMLIVGGPQVIPFHQLPNPLDDSDPYVLSDNPYASDDENYFVPSWPIGRAPGEAGSNPKALIRQLANIVTHRNMQSENLSWIEKLIHFIKKNLFLLPSYIQPSFGYTAEIWQRSANSVFRPIGKPEAMEVSPPTNSESLAAYAMAPANLAYFNLHGIEDGSEWYGQRDPLETQDGLDYPIALVPSDLMNGSRPPQIVFSEACYGANIVGKKVEDAICLKFLEAGSMAVIGSTCTSYGSLEPPLIAADQLGKLFWNFLNEGFPAGESLRRAKITFIREMQTNQGYLDGEDQKTLLSFILYGDPLAHPKISHNQISKNTVRYEMDETQLNTICDKENGHTHHNHDETIPEDVMEEVNMIVSKHLPGMKAAKIHLGSPRIACDGHFCPTDQTGSKSVGRYHNQRQIITLSKEINQDNHKHRHYARITLDDKGKLKKLAISR